MKKKIQTTTSGDGVAILVFGVTGDLAKRKILPALYRMFHSGTLGKKDRVIGIGRRTIDQKEHTELVFAAQGKQAQHKQTTFPFIYASVAAETQDETLHEFKENVLPLIEKRKRVLCYLAVPAQAVPSLLPLLSLLKKRSAVQVLVEKPFGTNRATSQQLENLFSKHFTENEIYRVDHYAAKELVQNILALRFANPIFDRIWNNQYIDQVQISICEELGVEERAAYYEEAGALRDIIQNHMMHLLALVAMESPLDLYADQIQRLKTKVLFSVPKVDKKDIFFGQYRGGELNKSTVPGYRNEHGVAKHSTTETYVALKLQINNPRWKGVPFFLRTGKRLGRKHTEIHLILKDTVCNLFCKEREISGPNIITIRVQPNEGIALRMNVKDPGSKLSIKPVMLDFCHSCLFGANTIEAYEQLLMDALHQDHTLFTRFDFVDEAWRITDQIRLAARRKPLLFYRAGSSGPAEAKRMFDGKETWIGDEEK